MVAVLLVITFFFFSISEVQASGEVKINEILADPPAGQGEWIELYSTSGQFNLSGWILEDAAGTKKSLNNVEICGNFAVYQYSTDGWLNNAGSESIYLLDQNNNIIDQLINFTNPGESKTVGRTPDGNNNWQTIDSPSKCSSNGSNQPSQDQQQPTPTPSQTQSGQVWLSEFLPNPQESNEWVEVFNSTSSSLDISGYKIDDIEGGSSPFTISQGTTIGPQNYLYFSFSSRLNNDGDSVRLIDASGKVLEEYSYGKSTKGVSFAKDAQGAWQETTTPTPGAANIITKPQVEGTTTEGKTSQSTSKKSTSEKPASTSKPASEAKSTTSKQVGTVLSTSTEEAVLPQATLTAADEAKKEEQKVASERKGNLSALLFVAAGLILLLGIGAKVVKTKKKK